MFPSLFISQVTYTLPSHASTLGCEQSKPLIPSHSPVHQFSFDVTFLKTILKYFLDGSATAIESEELAHVRYDEGSTTYLEVLEQQRQSFSAQLDLLANRLNIVNSYILLYKALGGGWLTPEEEQEFLEQQQQQQQQQQTTAE